ncbi:MAG: carboxylating nicotinate-nucleotide diphosphorylase [Gallionella sp.]|nr:carboxylating nicotinate-nucleotide diphosphorylase [Gallionella sp.]MDD4947701.1 carboxylating nicotinate-nucleotide diphosphorylase [Gallionella sp.]MDD5612536.1 carboxylating nicotinate-nucleotide diphosphorylase [Gallionella sp.]
MTSFPPTSQLQRNVRASLDEDIASGDLTAQLLPPFQPASAQVISRQTGVLCGTAWFDACFTALDADCRIDWQAKDGERITPGQTLCRITGNARALLSAERNALNLLQTLSGTATTTRRYVDAVAGLPVKIMDTRKTLPGLRDAQKYAVRMGGGYNQRTGLYDGILIKENHIAAAGGISAVLKAAASLAPPGVSVQIEVENWMELDEALNAGAKLILLDNFDLEALASAVKHTAGRAELEASGGITLAGLREVAETGVDRISIGALTKDVEALDLSMRFI